MKILSARDYNDRLKVTVQMTGRMNFNVETGESLGLTTSMGIKFFKEGEPEELYMAVMPEPDPDSFPIKKSGQYFYVNAKLLFDALKVDYSNFTVFYDLTRCSEYDEEAGGKCFSMNVRYFLKRRGGDYDYLESPF